MGAVADHADAQTVFLQPKQRFGAVAAKHFGVRLLRCSALGTGRRKLRIGRGEATTISKPCHRLNQIAAAASSPLGEGGRQVLKEGLSWDAEGTGDTARSVATS